MFLSTGNPMLNLACSDRVDGGFGAGEFVYLVGDSTSGKSFLAATCLAEAAQDKRFDDYTFIYDDPEGGLQMDLRRFFGAKAAKRIRHRRVSGKVPCSNTIQEFYYNIDDAFEEGRPFIWIEDSFDALDSKEGLEKFADAKAAHRADKKITGSYGMQKAKVHSEYMRQVIGNLQKTNSILIGISQTRDKVDGIGYETKTRSGGKALRFYANLEIWSSVAKTLKKSLSGIDYDTGKIVHLQVKKNRHTGRNRAVDIPIYYDLGMDGMGSAINWLLEIGTWKKQGNTVITGLLAKEVPLVKLPAALEEAGVQGAVHALLQSEWNRINAGLASGRRPRYS